MGALLAFGIVIFVLFLFMFAIAASSEQAPRVRTGSILVLPVGGAIPEVVSDDPLTQSFRTKSSYDLYDIKRALQKAAVDPRIDGIWLQVRPMETGWGSLQEIRNSLLTFKDSGKFIVASSEDRPVGEGALFLASVADEVYAAAQAPFEFNGFYIAVEYYKNLLDKLDVQAQPIRAGDYKSAVEPFIRTNLSPENREQLQALIDDRYEIFIDAIAEGRDLSTERVRAILDGELIFTATDAYREGLVDDLLFRDEVEAAIKNRLGLAESEELREVSIRSYINVPDSEAGLETGRDAEIAVVYAVGTIMTGESGYSVNPLFGGDVVGSKTFNEAVREAAESDRVKAVVVRIDSPGGLASASDAMWREITLAAEEKPVIISMGNVAASGGFWIATAGDMIVADPLTITGSIGVFSLVLDTSGLFENKIGVNFDVVRTGPFADMYSGTRGLSPEEVRLIEQATDETYKNFLQLVAESRGMTPEQVDELARGRVWTGLDAKEVGLVDRLGDLQDAIDIAAEQASLDEGTYRIRALPRPKTVLEQLEETLATRAEQAWMRLTLSPEELIYMREKERLGSLLDMHGKVQAWWPYRLVVR